jgi:predicted nucleotidyltransferase
MSAHPTSNDLSLTLFGKTRRAVLSILFGHTDEAFYLRQICRSAGAGLGAVQRELKQLSEVGIIQRTTRGRQVYYQANPESPIFEEIKGLVIKTSGVADVLRGALAPLGDSINVAFVFGSMSRGEETGRSDVDVLVVGSVTFADVARAFGEAQKTLGREVNPTVYPPDEFQFKLAKGHHFLETVLAGTKIFLVGDERELERVAGKRLAD